MVLSTIFRRSGSFVSQVYCRTLSTQSHRNLILPATSSLRQFSTSPSPSCKDNDSLVKDTKPPIIDDSLVKELLSKLQSLQRDIESLRKPNADSLPTDESLVKSEVIDESLPQGNDESLPRGNAMENTFRKVIQSEISKAVNLSNLSNKDTNIPEDFPFEIDLDIPGTRSIYLSKEYKEECVEVKVEIPRLYTCTGPDISHEYTYKEQKNCSTFSMNLTVGVICKSSNSKKVEFKCQASGDKISIYTAKYPADYNDGVHFSDMDENLRKEFHKYLELRGITLTTTNFLFLYMLDKANRERLRLLTIFEELLV